MLEPLRVPPDFWRRGEVSAALDQRDIGALFRLLRQHAGASQTRIGIAVAMPQSQVSIIMAAGPKARRVTAHEVFVRIADGLNMPDEARHRLGLAPGDAPADSPPRTLAVGSDHAAAVVVDRPDDPRDEPAVRRRELFGVAAAAVSAAIPEGRSNLAGLADVLTRYGSVPGPSKVGLRQLRAALHNTRQRYQASEYDQIAGRLPRLLAAFETATAETAGDDRRRVQALAADAYHVAAGVLLRFEDHGLASLAADRSVRAAHASDDPIAIAASARVIARALAGNGYGTRAEQLATDAAERLSRTVTDPTPESLSLYGSLLLHGAVAAVDRGDRSTALTLLDEAAQAGRQLGTDGNYCWTAFGPTNVLVHRVNVCATLGDGGTAIDYARRIDLTMLPTPERRAVMLLDVARAYRQMARYEQAYHAIRHAETIAPGEVRSRPAAHRIISDLAFQSPRSLQPQILRYARSVGVEL